MESIRLPYKTDAFGNDILARISWKSSATPKPIAIIYHGGGLLAGSSEIIPKAQCDYLTEKGFLVVAPNYRLCPQVTAADSIADCEEAYDWTNSKLPDLLKVEDVSLDTQKVVTMGHSTGGTIAMHIAATKTSVSACTAFYPTLYASDPATSAHQPWTLPPYMAGAGGFTPSDEDWKSITPSGIQLSESAFSAPGSVPPARSRWQYTLLQNGLWLKTICPDGKYIAIDPLAAKLNANWPPTLLIQGSADDAPGSSLDLAQRAEKDMKNAGIKEVGLEIVEGVGHMFDMALTSVSGAGWDAVIKGLNHLTAHAGLL